jgi:hypothetical protein
MERDDFLQWLSRRKGVPKRLQRLLELRRLDREGYPPELLADFIDVHDRGSEVTVVTLAGMGVVVGGMVKFEFRRFLDECGGDYNTVFVRDVRRLNYHVRPDGQLDGLAFFEKEIRRRVAALGARYTVTLGTSVGADAALYFGARCRTDYILAFSPVVDARNYDRRGQILRAACNVRRAIGEPRAYAEHVAIALATKPYLRRMNETIGMENTWDVLATLAASNPRPKSAVFFSSESPIDAPVCRQFGQFEEVELVPLPTASHNTAGFLRRRGDLGSIIVERIRAATSQEFPPQRAAS